MLCPKCGTQNDDNSAFCFECGQKLAVILPEPQAQQENTPEQTTPEPFTPTPLPEGDAQNPYAPPSRFYPEADAAAHIPNYLTPAIILTVISCFSMCCSCFALLGVPFGIVALVYANKVNTLLAGGNFAQARQASDNAKLWCWITAGVLIVSVLLGLLIFGFAMFSSILQDIKH